MPPKQAQECPHQSISYTPSPHAAQVKYKQPSLRERQAASKPTPSSKPPPAVSRSDLENFPAPLILPGDDLALDPDYPPQCFQEWHDEEERNHVAPRKRCLYVVPPPAVQEDFPVVESWTKPLTSSSSSGPEVLPNPKAQDVLDYVGAFYHGLPVKRLSLSNWGFSPWEEGKVSSSSKGRRIRAIGLNAKRECIRIRARTCPDKLYPYQLNLDDLLDAAISILPSDAYALCMLVDHDLYEDEDDTFVCGRAYGGSRVAVVSTARYNPILDTVQSVERQHAWPASHCKSYIESTCRSSKGVSKRQKTSQSHTNPTAPLEAALAAFTNLSSPSSSVSDSSPSVVLSALWLARMCRTVSHELGHCFGIDHCTYYACIMQGSASLSEDTRQPPYLCPVDLAKVLYSTGSTAENRYRALLGYCERSGVKELPHFSAFAAWLRVSLALDGV